MKCMRLMQRFLSSSKLTDPHLKVAQILEYPEPTFHVKLAEVAGENIYTRVIALKFIV